MILVTGAAGYIGSYFIHELMKVYDVNEIKAVDSFEVGSIKEIDQVPVKHIDLTDQNEVEHLMKDVTIVVHCAAISSIPSCEEDSKRAILCNLLSLKHLLEAGRQQQLQKIIFPSSFAVYASEQPLISEESHVAPYNFYGLLKYWAEQLIISYGEQFGLDYVIFRQTNVCGKGLLDKKSVLNLMCQAAKADEPLTIFGTGSQVRNFIHIKDVVKFYRLALTDHQGIYNLAGRDTKSIKTIAESVVEQAQKHLNKDIKIIYKATDREGKELTTPDFVCSTAKLNRDFHLTPSITVKEMIEELLV